MVNLWNKLKYLPIELRMKPSPISEEGLFLSKLKAQSLNYGGSKISFNCPRNSIVFLGIGKNVETNFGSCDLSNVDVCRHLSSDTPFEYRDWWNYIPCFARGYNYHGAWFTGLQSTVYISVDIVAPGEENGSFSKLSFFHPRVFEQALAEYLTAAYGYERGRNGSMFVAPVNWAPFTFAGKLNAVRFDVETHDQNPEYAQVETNIAFPVDHNRFVLIGLSYGDVKTTPGFEVQKKLIDSIIETIKLESSAKMLKDFQSATRGLTDTSLTPTFPPLDWSQVTEDMSPAEALNLAMPGSDTVEQKLIG